MAGKGRQAAKLLAALEENQAVHVDSLSFQHEHKEVFMTSYFRHAPVGGKQAGIQPECNQYRHSPNLLGVFFFFFRAEQRSDRGFISCGCRIQFSLCPGIHAMGQGDTKALIRTERRAEEWSGGGVGEAALYSSAMTTPPPAQLLPGLEVVFSGL